MVGQSETPSLDFPKFVLGRDTGPRPRRYGWRLGLLVLVLAGGALVFSTNVGNVRERSAQLYTSLAGSLTLMPEPEPGREIVPQAPVDGETVRQLADARGEIDTLRASLRRSEERVAKLNTDLEQELRRRTDALATRSDAEAVTKDAIRKLTDMLDQASRDKKELEQRLAGLASESEAAKEEAARLKSQLEDEDRKRTEAEAARNKADSGTHEEIGQLHGQLDAAHQDKSDLERQIADLKAQQAEAIANVRAEESKALDDMLAAASAENNQLRNELAALRTKSADQSRTIYEWAPERTKATQTIRDLQRDASLQAMKIKEQADLLARYEQEATDRSTRIASLESQVRFSASTRAAWGAAAWSRKNGVIYALPNQTKEKSAVDGALAICAFKSRGPCELVQSFNNVCFSVARIDGQGARPDNWLASTAATWQEAEVKAVADCERHYGRSCSLRFTNCSPDSLSNPSSD